MQTRNRYWIYAAAAAVMVALVVTAVACGHVAPGGNVRSDLKKDMEEYMDAADHTVSAMDSVVDATEFADSCWSWGCLGEAIENGKMSCALKEMSDASNETEAAQENMNKWKNDPDLTEDERAYISDVEEYAENQMTSKAVQMYISKNGCGGC